MKPIRKIGIIGGIKISAFDQRDTGKRFMLLTDHIAVFLTAFRIDFGRRQRYNKKGFSGKIFQRLKNFTRPFPEKFLRCPDCGIIDTESDKYDISSESDRFFNCFQAQNRPADRGVMKIRIQLSGQQGCHGFKGGGTGHSLHDGVAADQQFAFPLRHSFDKGTVVDSKSSFLNDHEMRQMDRDLFFPGGKRKLVRAGAVDGRHFPVDNDIRRKNRPSPLPENKRILHFNGIRDKSDTDTAGRFGTDEMWFSITVKCDEFIAHTDTGRNASPEKFKS